MGVYVICNTLKIVVTLFTHHPWQCSHAHTSTVSLGYLITMARAVVPVLCCLVLGWGQLCCYKDATQILGWI